MNKILFITLLSLFSLSIDCFSQNWNISGKIVNNNNISIDAAEAILFINDKPVISGLTNESGEFILKDITPNMYSLLIKQLGDTLYLNTINLIQNVDLGTIVAKHTSKQLNEVVILGKKNLLKGRTINLSLMFRIVCLLMVQMQLRY